MTQQNTFKLKSGLAQMLKGGVIMDVMNVEQAQIAEKAGAVAIMALEKIPSQLRKEGGVARMSDPTMIQAIKKVATIPVMAKVRIGHFVEAQVLESLDIDFIDESEVLTPADEQYHIEKMPFSLPFVCGARNLGEALRRIEEGAAMIRTKGEAGTGNIVEAVRHQRQIQSEIEALTPQNIGQKHTEYQVSDTLLEQVMKERKLPVVNFAAGGIANPTDAALMMQLGSDGVFVGSGIFAAENPEVMAKAIVEAVRYYDDPKKLATLSAGLGELMESFDMDELTVRYAGR
jgi:pyridoxal 5'-phosphate synthase pdxS subunit